MSNKLKALIGIIAIVFIAGISLIMVNRPAPESTSIDQDTPQKVESTRGHDLVFSDEFNGAELDASKWTNCYPGNNCDHDENAESMCYTPNNTTLKDGKLVLTAKVETKKCDNGKDYKYTSGLIQTNGKFEMNKGYVELKAKTPKGKGFWPTAWLLPTDNSWPPEIDILEQVGSNPDVNFMALHYKQKGAGGDFNAYQQQTFKDGTDFTAGFHKYAASWTENKITWFVDDKEVASYTNQYNVPNVAMYLILNLAVGGHADGEPNDQTTFPNAFEVDYIRVYKTI